MHFIFGIFSCIHACIFVASIITILYGYELLKKAPTILFSKFYQSFMLEQAPNHPHEEGLRSAMMRVQRRIRVWCIRDALVKARLEENVAWPRKQLSTKQQVPDIAAWPVEQVWLDRAVHQWSPVGSGSLFDWSSIRGSVERAPVRGFCDFLF